MYIFYNLYTLLSNEMTIGTILDVNYIVKKVATCLVHINFMLLYSNLAQVRHIGLSVLSKS